MSAAMVGGVAGIGLPTAERSVQAAAPQERAYGRRCGHRP
jgi:hypothetical protein